MAERSLGPNYPLRRSNDGYFDKAFTSLDQARSTITNVLSTRRGERVMNPQFGTRLHDLLFEPLTPQLQQEIQSEVEQAIDRYVPYVQVRDISAERDVENQTVILNVRFSTAFLPDSREENLEIFFELEEDLN
jgi:hypothetical protein